MTYVIIGVLFLLLELITGTTIAFFIAVGFIVAGVVSFFINEPLLLIFLGGATSLGMGFFIKSKGKNGLFNDKKITNAYNEYLGKEAIVTKEFDSSKLEEGVVKISGIEWNAISNSKASFKKDEIIIIEEIKGNKFIVKKGE